MLNKTMTALLTTTILANVSGLSGEKLTTPDGLKFGLTDAEQKSTGFHEAPTNPDLTAARGILTGTPLADIIPAQRKGAKPDAKVVVEAKNNLVYFLAVKYKEKDYELKNRIAAALGLLGYNKLAMKFIEKMNPVRIMKDGETLVVITPPRSFAFKHEAQKVGLKATYHGDEDKKWAKMPPYTNRSTGEIMKHVRTVPATEQAKLEKVLSEAFGGRLLVVENGNQTTVRLLPSAG